MSVWFVANMVAGGALFPALVLAIAVHANAHWHMQAAARADKGGVPRLPKTPATRLMRPDSSATKMEMTCFSSAPQQGHAGHANQQVLVLRITGAMHGPPRCCCTRLPPSAAWARRRRRRTSPPAARWHPCPGWQQRPAPKHTQFCSTSIKAASAHN